MKLNDPLPRVLEQKLEPLLADGEEVLYSQRSDLLPDRHFGESFLVVTDRKVVTLAHGQEPVAVKLHDISEVKVDELFGSGRLMAATDDGDIALLSYSKSLVPQFAVFSRVITDLAHARKPKLPDDEAYSSCQRCGAPLPERGASCPLCIPKLQILLRLFGLLKPYKRRLALLLLMTFTTVLTQMCPPYITKLIIDDVIERNSTARLPLWIGLMLLCGVLFLVAKLVGGNTTAWLGARVVADLRASLHSTLQRLRLNYFHGRESGQIIGRVMHDTGELQHFLIDGSSYFLVEIISFVGIAAVLIYLDPWLAMLVFLPVPFLVGGGRMFWKRLIPLFHKRGSKVGALHSVLSESIRGLKAVKAYSGEKRRVGEFNATNEELFGLRFSLESTWIGFSEGMFWLMSLGVTAVWFFAARRIVVGSPGETLTIGTLLAFVGYIWLFYGPLQWFTAILNWMTNALSGAERIFAVLDAREEIYEAPDAVDLPKIKGELRFERVRFSYERGKEVLKGISFNVKAGQMIGLVGRSGAGKSTVINLVSRFYDVDSGTITIDGHPIQKLRLEQLRRQIGVVMQDPFLFNASIEENIRYGMTSASFEDIVRAARAARAHDFIVSKEDGYDSIVGERGIKLSGGEKQRLAIARAILHDPPILILDEATSAVDTETETGIQEAMAALIEGRTTIAIAHRLSTLRNADRLMVIDNGRVAEAGTHDELLAKDGIYARLVRMQTELSKIRGEVWKE